MAITSYPFDESDTTEAQFSQWARELQDSGVADTHGGNGFKVTADGSAMKVFVAPGFAIVRGMAVRNTASYTVTLDPASGTARTDRIVLRLDPATDSILPVVLKGTPGAGDPALTQTDIDVFELRLAKVAVGATATSIAAGNVTDDRVFTGSGVTAWSDATRPSAPRKARLGLNTTSGKWEFWDGTSWSDLAPTVSFGTITGLPATFPPAAHTHDVSWTSITGKPAYYPPGGHMHEWEEIFTPASFPPSAHSHSWASITSKPTSFPASAHTHNPPTTVAYANGSERVRDRTPAGSGWYAAWVDGNDNFCHNTSSIRFKENVRDYAVDPLKVLALQPRVYDRKPVDGVEGQKDEYGLIAEEVNELVPELVVRDRDGNIDSLRYDLLGLALLDVVKHQAAEIAELRAAVEGLMAR